MLEFAKSFKKLKVFFYFSTDEVFGPAPRNFAYKEWDRHLPTNPYSASNYLKLSELFLRVNTYNLPIYTVGHMNVERKMHEEKFIR